MTEGSLEHFLAAEADYPLFAERVAIDITGALRGAETGLRALRGRPLLRRFWEGVTGAEQEGENAIGVDLVAAQRAALALVGAVMREENRTQYCVNRVLLNLLAVNRQAEEMMVQVAGIEDTLRAEQAQHVVWIGKISEEAGRLARDLEDVQQRLDYLDATRRLTERYRVGKMSRDAGELLGAALFLAEVGWQHASLGSAKVHQELEVASLVVEQRLGARGPRPLDEAVLDAANGISPSLTEAALYLEHDSTGFLRAVGMLVERRGAGLPVDRVHAADAVVITRSIADPRGQLAAGLIKDAELVRAVGQSLLPPLDLEQ